MSGDKQYYRKYNDRTHNSGKYHKKDGTNTRAKLKQELQKGDYNGIATED